MLPRARATVTTQLPGERLLVRVLQDLVRRERFPSYADLVEAFKCRCAALRIPYDSTVIKAAIDQLERGGRRPLIGSRSVATRTTDEVADTSPHVSREEASAILKRIRERTHGPGPKTIKPALRPRHSQRVRDAARALAMVTEEIRATAERIDSLEREDR